MLEYSPFNESGISPDEWDNFVETSDNGTIFHKRRFLSYHPEGKFKDASLIFRKQNKLFSIFPAVEIERDGKKYFPLMAELRMAVLFMKKI
jgi:hypothetical protein